MKCLLVSRTSNKGFTLLELMVGIAMTLTLGGLALAALSDAERGFTKDKNKLEDGQKLSSVLEIVGRDIRQAGEQINEANFPVVRVIPDGSRGSRLIVYRSIDEALPVCGNIIAGVVINNISISSTDASIRLANASCNVPAGTSYPSILQSWSNRRAGQTIPAILHDGQGKTQLFNYTGESNANSYQTLGLTATAFTPSAAFPIRSTLYLVEKREYLICDGKLKVRINSNTEGDCNTADSTASPFQTIASNVSKMDIGLSVRDPASASQLAANPNAPDSFMDWPLNTAFPGQNPNFPQGVRNWQSLQGVTVKIAAIKTEDIKTNESPKLVIASGKFYPRNVLSSGNQ